MAFGSDCPADRRLVAASAGLVLAFGAMADHAAAAVPCNPEAPQHEVSTRCRAHPSRRPGHESARLRAANRARPASGDELTPLADSDPARSRWSWPTLSFPVLSFPSLRAEGQAADRNGASGPLPFDHGAVPISARDARNALADVVGVAAPARAVLSAPSVWSILPLGLLGLYLIVRLPRVAKVRSWAMDIPTRSGGRPETQAGGVDRTDPARYAEETAGRSHQGRFVRDATRSRFGAHV